MVSYTNSVIAKPRDIAFIASIKEDRPAFHPGIIVNQVALAELICVLKVKVVDLAKQT